MSSSCPWESRHPSCVPLEAIGTPSGFIWQIAKHHVGVTDVYLCALLCGCMSCKILKGRIYLELSPRCFAQTLVTLWVSAVSPTGSSFIVSSSYVSRIIFGILVINLVVIRYSLRTLPYKIIKNLGSFKLFFFSGFPPPTQRLLRVK